MAKKNDGQVRFADGCVVNRNIVYMASQVITLKDFEHSRMFNFKNEVWGHYDLDFVVWSICSIDKPVPAVLSIGRGGQIDINSKGKGTIETITDAGVGSNKLGYVNQIREIAGKLYVCGGSGQIYRREAKGWEHFDDGVLDPK